MPTRSLVSAVTTAETTSVRLRARPGSHVVGQHRSGFRRARPRARHVSRSEAGQGRLSRGWASCPRGVHVSRWRRADRSSLTDPDGSRPRLFGRQRAWRVCSPPSPSRTGVAPTSRNLRRRRSLVLPTSRATRTTWPPRSTEGWSRLPAAARCESRSGSNHDCGVGAHDEDVDRRIPRAPAVVGDARGCVVQHRAHRAAGCGTRGRGPQRIADGYRRSSPSGRSAGVGSREPSRNERRHRRRHVVLVALGLRPDSGRDGGSGSGPQSPRPPCPPPAKRACSPSTIRAP